MKKGLFLSLLIFISAGLILPQYIFAQVSIGISPVVFELSGNAGELIENQVKVTNPSDNTVGIKMTVEDIAPTGEAGFVTVEPAETETYSLAGWTRVDPTEFTLAPNEERWVKFTVTIPPNAEPGGHYGSIVAGSNIIAGSEVTGAGIVARVGVLVLLTVPGEMKENLTVSEFKAPVYSEKGPINFEIKFQNIGTVHTKPRGLITITNLLGKKVADISFPERNVLPSAIRKFDATWDKNLLWGIKYTATLSGSYGESNIPFSPQVITFWAFPWKYGLIILGVLILMILARKRLITALRILIKGR
jgi:hypothetical protein